LEEIGLSEEPAFENSEGPKKLSIVVFSGDYDKVFAAFSIATAAASMGAEVSLFFTFWGLSAIRKGQVSSPNRDVIQKLFGVLNRPGLSNLPLSKLNFLGIGRRLLSREMKKLRTPGLEELIDMARSLGVEMIACTMSMGVMGIPKDDFIDGVDKFTGAAAYFQNAAESDVNLFI
jgi:peroxiredoxin family protein